MRLSDLPDIDFVDVNKDVIVTKLMGLYKKITGRDLRRGDPVRLFVLAQANIIVMLLNIINETGKQNLLKYAKGDNLDHIGALVGCARLGASSATSTIRLTLSKDTATTAIPKGVRYATRDNVIFQTVNDVLIVQGSQSADIDVECVTPGDVGNGYDVGAIELIVDRLPYVDHATNITRTAGGANVESDEHYRERIHTAPESFSCAGPEGAYKFFAKSVNTNIADVLVISPAPGEVELYPVMVGGGLPEQEVLKAVEDGVANNKNVRPLTDKVSVKAPKAKNYGIDLTYYILESDRGRASDIQKAVDVAVLDFIEWQRSVVGRDINPSELIRRVVMAGAKRVEVRSPVFTHVASGTESDSYAVELAVNTSKNIVYGGYEDE